VWDKDGKSSAWSEPATFEMGLLRDKDWQGKWIGAGVKLRYMEGIPIAVGSPKGLGLDLGGTNAYVRIPHAAILKPSQAMVITAWICLAKYTPKWQCIIRKSDGPVGQWLLAIGEEGPVAGVYCGFVIDGKYYEKGAAVDPTVLTDGSWHLTAATYDGSYYQDLL